jgi:hypothetical protein
MAEIYTPNWGERGVGTSARYYRPRMMAQLTIPVAGTRAERINQAKSSSSITLPLVPIRARLESNDHNTADRCTVTCDWTAAGVDPRMLEDGVLQLHIGNADEFGYWTPDRSNCRFIGMIKEVSADRRVEEPGTVTLECVDYTDLFLLAKPFGSAGVPRYEQTIDDAWRTIISQTPGAEALADALRYEGGAQGLVIDGIENTPIGLAVSERFRKLAKVPVHPDGDAWACWQQCVGALGLISYIRLDECVLTTATNYYTERDAPRLVWGHNIESWTETRLSSIAKTGIALTSFDPITQRTIEAYWPPLGDDRVKRKRGQAKKVSGEDELRQRERRDYFSFPGVTNPEALIEIAKRVWEERSRQELEGRVSTAEMTVETESGADFDLLSLGAGATVEVRVLPEHRQLLAALPSDSARVQYLLQRGYTEQVANLITKNMANFADLGAKFHTRKVVTELEFNPEGGGSFSVEVDYVNRIVVDGSTDAGADQ